MNDMMLLLLFFILVVFVTWVIISLVFKIPFLAKENTGTHKKFEDRRQKLLAKLNHTLEAIDNERKYYRGDWNMVEVWMRHAKRDIPSYDRVSLIDDSIYEALNKTLDVGLADVIAGKNPYDSDYLMYKFSPDFEENKNSKK